MTRIQRPAGSKSKVDFDSASDGAAGNNRDVIRLPGLIIEQVLPAKIQRYSARDRKVEHST